MLKLLFFTDGITKLIERSGRVCYKSENRISDNSDLKFINSLVKSGHESVIEHSNIVFKLSQDDKDLVDGMLECIFEVDNLLTIKLNRGYYYIGGNLRMFKDLIRGYIDAKPCTYFVNPFIKEMLYELSILPRQLFADMDNYLVKRDDVIHDEENVFCINSIKDNSVKAVYNYDVIVGLPKELYEEFATATLLLKEDRSTSHQEVRHRRSSYSQESQRYVDMTDRFRYSVPKAIDREEKHFIDLGSSIFVSNNGTDECAKYDQLICDYDDVINIVHSFYKTLRGKGIKPEDARSVLPNCAISDIVVTRTLKQWRHYLTLRGEAHAQLPIRVQAIDILKVFHSIGYLTDLKIDSDNNIIY